MAQEHTTEAHEQLKGKVEGRVKELANKRDIERAAEFGRSFDELTAALRQAQKDLDASLAGVDAKGQEQVRDVFNREFTEALTALRDNLPDDHDAIMVIDTARRELEALGAVAKKGPEAYPKPKLWGLLGKSQVEQWIEAADRDSTAVIQAIADFTSDRADRVVAEAQTEAAKQEGVKTEAGGEHALTTYARASTAEKMLVQKDVGEDEMR